MQMHKLVIEITEDRISMHSEDDAGNRYSLYERTPRFHEIFGHPELTGNENFAVGVGRLAVVPSLCVMPNKELRAEWEKQFAQEEMNHAKQST